MKERELQKYLRKCRLLPVEPGPVVAGFRCAAVIPACDELEEIGNTLASLAPGADDMVLLVVNHPADAPSRVKAASGELLRLLASGAFSCRNLFWIDAPDLTGGVGEARKLGMDAVIASCHAEQAERVILASLDADTVAEPDYFDAVRGCFERNPAASALSISFSHRPGATPEEERAIRSYEAYLERYVDRLRRAGSPYAFQTVGSAFAVRAAAYVRAGGMRVRKGGEDFYFLQAAAKTGRVVTGDRVLVHPSPRPSDRVPFGTGPAVRKLMAGEAPAEISDAAFAFLGRLLARAAGPGGLEEAELFLDQIDSCSADFLRQEGFLLIWPKVLANTPDRRDARLAAFHGWFDGLKTLRYLHRIDRFCGNGIPSVAGKKRI